MGRYYILKDREVVPVPIEEWAKWFENSPERSVKNEYVLDHRISTVFMGIEYGVDSEGLPLLFETMIFKPGTLDGIYAGLTATYNDAEKEHEKAKSWLIKQTWKI